MDIEKLNLTGSRPLDLAALSDADRALLSRFPQDYQNFVNSTNGGILDGDSDWLFDTNIPLSANAPYNTRVAGLSELWAFTADSRERGDPELLTVVGERVEHAESEFLPTNVYAIGGTANDCLICLSLDEQYYGGVFYWDYRWRHPWLKSFFEARIAEAEERFDDVKAIFDDPDHPQYDEAGDALNYATLMQIAGSFSEFIDSLWEDKDTDE